MIKVKLTYFQQSGKWYAESEIDMEIDYLYVMWDRLEQMFKKGKRPGLVDGNSGFHVLVEIPNHPSEIPHLMLNVA